ncbi:hypothetical protein [Deinococcus marmoris]|uniref:hypothetical protein n=1 Tax=Deinococcus marmoris TaxID=249408 RepID=UPI000496A030|nr:hypothetical protein [Deinococcus marmoris]
MSSPSSGVDPHLTLVIQDDGTLYSTSHLRQWLTAVEAAARAEAQADRLLAVLVASHGGLVDQPAGERFAADVRQIGQARWSVTFITRTGFFETIGQELDRVFAGDVLDRFGALVDLFKQSGPSSFLPKFSATSPDSRPVQRFFMDSTPMSFNDVPDGARRQVRWGYVIGAPDPLKDAFKGDAEKLTRELTQLLALRVSRPQEELPRILEAAAQDAARMARQDAAGEAALITYLQHSLTGPSDLDGTVDAPQFRVHASGGRPGETELPAPPFDERIHWVEALVSHLGIGAVLWNSMKNRTGALFVEGAPGLEVLGGLFRAGVQVDLLGHSLGGMFVDHALRAVAARGYVGFVDRAIYLAPANTHQFFRDTLRHIQALLNSPAPMGFSFLGLTADEERTEVGQGSAVSAVYPRTILYLISNALEGRPHTPLLGMQRHFTAALVPGGSVIAWTPDAGLQLDHKTHGSFVHNPTVRHWIDQQLGAQA